MKTGLAGIIAVTMFLAVALYARSEQSDMSVDLDCPDIVVIGVPCIVTVSIQNRNPLQSPFPVPQLDLASRVDQGVALVFKFQADSRSPLYVGERSYGRPEVEFGPRPPTIGLIAGECVTFTIDLNQLLFGSELRKENALAAGKCRMTALFYTGAWESAPKEISIREPTPDEKQFVEAIQKQGVSKKWFPTVIADDNLQVPDDIPLPAETALLREFIKVLRLAVRNPDAAVRQIEDRKDSWGYLQDVVGELQYECIVKASGKDSAAAQDVRRTLSAEAKTKGRLTRLEKAGGLLDHFAELKAARSKDK